MYSNCCGAEASYLNDDLCGRCLEHASFEEDLDEELSSEELNKLMNEFYNN